MQARWIVGVVLLGVALTVGVPAAAEPAWEFGAHIVQSRLLDGDEGWGHLYTLQYRTAVGVVIGTVAEMGRSRLGNLPHDVPFGEWVAMGLGAGYAVRLERVRAGGFFAALDYGPYGTGVLLLAQAGLRVGRDGWVQVGYGQRSVSGAIGGPLVIAGLSVGF